MFDHQILKKGKFNSYTPEKVNIRLHAHMERSREQQ